LARPIPAAVFWNPRFNNLKTPNAKSPVKLRNALDDYHEARRAAARVQTLASTVIECPPKLREQLVQLSQAIQRVEQAVRGREAPRYDERVYGKLLDVLDHDEDGEVRDTAYGALVRLARAPEQAAAAVS
jgi:hypothetical protein